jgi:transposase
LTGWGSWERRIDEWRTELELFDRLEGWVTLTEAVERTGVSRSTLRNWYRNRQIRSRIEDGPYGPQRLVRLDDVTDRAARSPRIVKNAAADVAVEAEIAVLRTRIDQLERRLSVLEATSPTRTPHPG